MFSQSLASQKPIFPHKLWAICLILAPLLMFISSFFWVNGEYDVTGGTLVVFASVFWIPALMFLFGLLKEKYPNYAAWGLLIAILGFCSGMNFGFVGIVSTIFDISHQSYLEGFAKYPVSSGLLLFWLGPLAPLSLLVLAIMLMRSKTAPLWVGILLALGAIAFPLSRIPRIATIAHIADALMLIPMAYLGIKFLRKEKIRI